MRLKNGRKLDNGRSITFLHGTERYVNNLNVYNRSKNGTNLWDDLIYVVAIEGLILELFVLKTSRNNSRSV